MFFSPWEKVPPLLGGDEGQFIKKNDETNPFADFDTKSPTHILLPLGEGARRADEGRSGEILFGPCEYSTTKPRFHCGTTTW
jgi:hypothetical protein